MLVNKCQLCDNASIDSVEFETGNNAEYGVEVSLCEAHLEELDAMGYAFEDKYAAQILQTLYDRWVATADNQEER
jgi:hypothetical protein